MEEYSVVGMRVDSIPDIKGMSSNIYSPHMKLSHIAVSIVELWRSSQEI